MRVALTSFYLPSDSKIGAGWMSHRLANALADRGHDITMFSPSARCVDARYQHVQVSLRGPLRIIKWAWGTRKLDLSGFDALLAQGDDHFVKRTAVPVHVRTLHGSCFDEARHAPRWSARLRMLFLGITELVSAVRTPCVVGVSKSSIRMYPWLHRVIPNGVDTSVFGPEPAGRTEHPTILFVGTWDSRKRGSFLADAFERSVLPEYPDARLLMVCSDAPSRPGIEVLGRLDDAELAAWYRKAWVFCLPSTYEGFGVPYAEALVSGTPVVATDNPGAREVLAEGGGMIVTDDDLGPTLRRLLGDDRLRAELGSAARSAGERFHMDRVAEAYEALLASGAGRRRSLIERLVRRRG